MTELFYTITTNRGKEKIQEYYRESKTLPLTHMGFGGINGDEVNYQRPNVDMVQVPNEWTRINLERFPEEGFIGGGATIENRIEEYKGKWICNVGIYDEDGELILIAAYRPLLVDPEEAIVSSYPINIQTVLSNTEHVVVQTDTSITHPTHDEMNQALEELGSKLSKYATTDAAGLTELATQSEVDNRSGSDRVVTTQTLDKPGLINFLQKYADDEIEKLKELIFGGNPSAALDTLFELAAAYENADDAIQTILNELSTKLTKEAFNSFVEEYNAFKLSVDESIGNLNKVDRYEYIKDVGDVRYSVYLIKRNGIVMANIGILLTSGAAVTSWLSDIIPLEFRPHFPITIAARAYKTKPGSPVELILASATIATHGGIALTPHQNTDPTYGMRFDLTATYVMAS